ncbi:MAG: LysM peptidoglycan-binding domain-containing protein [Cyclobacteriaceae bacterium]
MIKLLFLIAFSWNAELPKDSLGIETINGQTFVIHKVEEKETLFGISRRYRSTVDAILQYNVVASSGLEIGQILKVPYTPRQEKRPVDGTVHKVAPKETLYSISRTYQVSMEDIKAWNNMTDNALSIGQELIIRKSNTTAARTTLPPQQEKPVIVSKKGYHTVQPKETLFSIARQYGVTIDQLKEWNHLEGSALDIGENLYVSRPEAGDTKPQEVTVTQPAVTVRPPDETRSEPKETPSAPVKKTPVLKNTAPATTPESRGQSAESIRISESLKSGDEIIEDGLAELIEGTEANRKYLALHRTAPMGTILKVRNEMNNREVFVRVMGKLPDTALTDRLIIRISKSAYDRLGAIDPRFRVEVTYYK